MRQKVETMGISLVIGFILTTTGCFAVRKLDLAHGYEGFKKLHPEKQAGPEKSGGRSIAVEVSVPPTYACVMAKTADPEGEEAKGIYTCELFPVNEATAKDALKAKADTIPESIDLGLLLLGSAILLRRRSRIS